MNTIQWLQAYSTEEKDSQGRCAAQIFNES